MIKLCGKGMLKTNEMFINSCARADCASKKVSEGEAERELNKVIAIRRMNKVRKKEGEFVFQQREMLSSTTPAASTSCTFYGYVTE